MSEIKPCPFCGSTDIKLHDEISHAVWCQECFAEMPSIDIESAVELWNTRPIEDELRARIAELEAESDQLTARLCQERQDDKWIPVSERLPEDWTMVLFTNGVTRGIGQFDKDGFYDYWYEYSFNKPVTHWMPLPNPPEVK